MTSDTIHIKKLDNVHIQVTSDSESVERELSDHFSFLVPGYQYMPSFKRGMWDGHIRLFKRHTGEIYRGLLPMVQKFAKDRGYPVKADLELFQKNSVTMEELEAFIDTLNLPDNIERRDYQMKSILECINEKRITLLSPTSSGKSLILYIIAKFLGLKTLIVVPTKNLVHQLASDFKNDYGCIDNIHKVYSGEDKDTDDLITVTTWQSIFRMPKVWFQQFECVMIDETHQAKAKSLTSILEKMVHCEYRIGTTGTLDGTDTNRTLIEGLLGPVYRIVSTRDLIADKVLADFKISSVILKHIVADVKSVPIDTYQDEIDFIVGNPARNQFITKLVSAIPGNNLVMVRLVENHGDVLYKMFKESTDRPIYYIHGGVDAQLRDDYRAMIEKESNAIILATTGSFSTGANVKRLNNMFFCHPSKSRIVTLQSIGRVLRKSKVKLHANLFDIVDDLRIDTNDRPNFSLLHFEERRKIYQSEGFPHKTSRVNLE